MTKNMIITMLVTNLLEQGAWIESAELQKIVKPGWSGANNYLTVTVTG